MGQGSKAPARSSAADARVDEQQLVLVVDALCDVEAGRAPSPELPYATACWFLDRSGHFGAVAFATLRLIDRLARRGDDGLRARAARGLAPFVTLYPARVEHLLLHLAGTTSRDVHGAVVDVLVRLLHESDEPERVIQRWSARSEATRELVHIARKLLALRHPDLQARS